MFKYPRFSIILVFFSLFSIQTVLAAWTNLNDDTFFQPQNTESHRELKKLLIGRNQITRKLIIDIQTWEGSAARGLRTQLRQNGFSVSDEGSFSDIVTLNFSMEQSDQLKALIDELNRYEAIEPSEIVTRMKAAIDSQLASMRQLIHRNEQKEEKENKGTNGPEDVQPGPPNSLGFVNLTPNVGEQWTPEFKGTRNEFQQTPYGLVIRGGTWWSNGRLDDSDLHHSITQHAQDLSDRQVRQLYHEHAAALIPNRNAGQNLQSNQYRVRNQQSFSEAELELQCTICLTKIAEVLTSTLNSTITQVNCGGGQGGHGDLFCKACIEENYRHQTVCPNCKQELMVSEEDLVESSQYPFIINTSIVHRYHWDLLRFYKNGATAFCKAKGKKLITYETKESKFDASSLAIYGDTLTPRPIPQPIDGTASHTQYTQIICGNPPRQQSR